MSDHQFDKEVTALYQQRKSQLIAPQINFTKAPFKPKYFIVKFSAIFTVAGIASFGIMAIVTHFAKIPQQQIQVEQTQYQVNLEAVQTPKLVEEVVLTKIKLPPQPKVPPVKLKLNLSEPVENKTSTSKVDKFELARVQVVKLPQLKEPEISIKPVYKIMPKYSQKALQNNHSGTIRLRYEIDGSGNVKNIEVVKSEESRDLQRAAKKALTQWKYNPNDNVLESYEIIFEFNATRS